MSLAKVSPKIWDHLKLKDQQVLEQDDAVLVHLHVSPSEDIARPVVQRAASQALAFKFEFPIVAEADWILIDVIERDELNAGALLNQRFVWVFIVALYVMLCLLSYAVSYFYGRQQYARAILLQESQRREKELDRYIESAPDGIVVFDGSGRIQRVNSRIESMLGYKREELVGKNVDTLVPPRWRQQHGSNRQIYYNNPHAIDMKMGSDFFALAKDGTPRPVDIALSSLCTDAGLLVISALRDISALKETERQLKIAKREANKANQAKSEFLANMSHEIRTPLNAVLGSTYLLGQNKHLDSSAATQVARIRRAGNALLSTINDVLDLSKIEAGELRLEATPLRLSHLMLDIEAIGHAQADQKDIDLIVEELPHDLARDVITDGVRLRQILLNLVSNAIKFTPKGRVTIETKVVEPPQGQDDDSQRQWVTFSICDTGNGIPEGLQQHLFEPFKQADSSTTRVFGGSGLGLTIVNELCQAMGGQISVESQPGKGSRFSVTLPFKLASEKEIERSGLQVRPLEILVCQDDPKIGRMAKEICEKLGWRAEVCPEGTALGKRLQRRFDDGNPADCLVMSARSDGLCNLNRLKKLTEILGPNQMPCTLLLRDQNGDDQDGQPDILADMSIPVATTNLPLNFAEVFNQINELKVKRLGCSSSMLSRTKMDQDDLLWLPHVRILVVDDSIANRDVASSILTGQGATVFGCGDGAEALEWLQRKGNRVDLVLMDIQMPVMDGNQAVVELRKIETLRDLPVIALTAGALTSEKDRAIAAGMNDYLTKPFDPERMIRVLRQHLEANTKRVLPVRQRAQAEAQTGEKAAEKAEEKACWPNLPGVDLTLAKQRLSNDRALFHQTIQRLIEEFADFAQPEPLAKVADDAKALAARAHKLAGHAGLIGASQLYDAAKKVESLVSEGAADEAGNQSASLEPLLRQLSSLVFGLAEAYGALDVQDQAATRELTDAAAQGGDLASEGASPATKLTAAALEPLLDALTARKIAALELLEDLEPQLRGALDGAQWDTLLAAKAKLDYPALLAMLTPLSEQQALAELQA
jgi:PAS domain S-box-containing protein